MLAALATAGLLAGGFVQIERLLRGDAGLTRIERVCATSTLLVAAWTVVLTTLALLGGLKIGFVLAGGGVVALGAWLVRRWVPCPAERDGSPLGASARSILRELRPSVAAFLPFPVAALLYFGWLGWRLPIADFDGLMYHVPMAVHMVHDGGVREYPGESFYVNFFPKGGELLQSLALMAGGGLRCADLVQWPFAVLMALAGYGAARRLGLSREASTVGATTPLLAPILLYQSASAYVDLLLACWAFLGMCAVAGSDRATWGRRLWFWCCAGLAMGTKFSALPVFVVIGVWALARWGWRAMTVGTRARTLGMNLGAISLSLALGTPWLVRNLATQGSPIWPFEVRAGNEVLFAGPYNAKEIGEAKPWSDMTFTEKWYASWTGLDFDSWTRMNPLSAGTGALKLDELFDPDWGHKADERLGGFGAGWLVLALPSLVAAWIGSRLRGWAAPEGRVRAGLVLVCIALFMFTPSSWKPRFVLFLLPAAGLCVAMAWDAASRRARGGWLPPALLLSAAAFDWGTAVLMNRDAAKLHRWFETYPEAPKSPAEWFLWAAPSSPDAKARAYVVRHAAAGQAIGLFSPKVTILPGYLISERGDCNVVPFPIDIRREDWLPTMQDEGIRWMLLGPDAVRQAGWMRSVRGARLAYAVPGYQVWEIDPSRPVTPRGAGRTMPASRPR